MTEGAAVVQTGCRRAKIGETLIVALNAEKSVVLYPEDILSDNCTVCLSEGDEFSLNNIPMYLINLYHLDGLDLAKYVGNNKISFIDHPKCKDVPLHDFAGWCHPVLLTVTYQANEMLESGTR